MFKKLALATLGLFIFSTAVWGETYQVDPVHSQVHFSVKHLMMFTVRGIFTDFSGEIVADPNKQMIQSVKGTIKLASIDTREKKRDKHLRSPDFFNVGQFPDMTFVSKSFSGQGDNITAIGDLTIRGITKEITLTGKMLGTTKDPWGNTRIGFEAKGMINRKDFDIKWNKALETGGVMVGDNVEIALEIAAVEMK